MANSHDIYIGIDYSYTSPAITIFDDNKYHCYALWHQKSLPNKTNKFIVDNFIINLDFYDKVIVYNTDIERYRKLAEWSISKIKSHTDNNHDKKVHIAIEGYSMGSRIGFLFNIAENTGILKSGIIDQINGLETFIAYPPTMIKKSATRKGNAKKPDMANAFHDKFGFWIHELFMKKNPDTNPASDIVDSYFILAELTEFVKSFGKKLQKSVQRII